MPAIMEIYEVFAKVLSLSPESRDTALSEACSEDTELLENAKRLLDAHDQADLAGWMQDPCDLPTRCTPIGAMNVHFSPVVNIAQIQTRVIGTGKQPRIPDFALHRCIGAGGFGTVWLARSTETNVWRAVKIIPSLHELELRGIEEFLARIKDSPFFMPILHVGRIDGAIYVVMPKADDATESIDFDPDRYTPATLATRLKQGPLPADEVATIGAQLASALAIIHKSGIAHGDIKPANIMRYQNRWVFGDLGLVTQLDGNQANAFTPEYVSSSIRDKRVADLIALARTLYELASTDKPEGISSLIADPSRLGSSACARRLADAVIRVHEQPVGRAITTASEFSTTLNQATRTPWNRSKVVAAVIFLAATGMIGAKLVHTHIDNLSSQVAPAQIPSVMQEVIRLTVLSPLPGDPQHSVPIGELGNPGVVAREGLDLSFVAKIGSARWAAVVFCAPDGTISIQREYGEAVGLPLTSSELLFPENRKLFGLTDGAGPYGFVVVSAIAGPPDQTWFDRVHAAHNETAKATWKKMELPDTRYVGGEIMPLRDIRSVRTRSALEHPLATLARVVEHALDPTDKADVRVEGVMFNVSRENLK